MTHGNEAGTGGSGQHGGANRPPERDRSARDGSPWALAGLGMQFFASLLLFVYGGAWLDRRMDSSPLFLLLGVFVGGGGTFYLSYRRLTAGDRREP